MALDDGELLERRVYVNALYDLYGPLLTDRQRTVYEMRCFSDLSFGEIAETLEISRQAVHILVNRTAERLLTFERELGFAKRLECLESRIKSFESENFESGNLESEKLESEELKGPRAGGEA